MWADVNGRPLQYEDTGGDGPPILFTLAGDGEPQARGIDALADVWRVISCTAGAADPWALARDLLGLLDRLGIERSVLAGVGEGGSACIRAALLSPDRVRGLVVVGVQAVDRRDDDVAGRLEEIEAPALVVQGGRAGAPAVAHAEALCRGLHDCRGLEPIEGAAGAPLATHPDAVVEVLRTFLDELPG